MILRYLIILLILLPIKVFAVIEVDITRGNLNPLPIAISPLSIDEKSKISFNKVLAESALRAVKLCQPLRVPSTGYERWKELQLNFDAREMLEG